MVRKLECSIYLSVPMKESNERDQYFWSRFREGRDYIGSCRWGIWGDTNFTLPVTFKSLPWIIAHTSIFGNKQNLDFFKKFIHSFFFLRIILVHMNYICRKALKFVYFYSVLNIYQVHNKKLTTHMCWVINHTNPCVRNCGDVERHMRWD